MSHFSDSLHGMKELLQFGQIKSDLEHLNKESESVNAREKEVAQAQHLQASLSFLVIGLAIMLVAVLAISQANQGQNFSCFLQQQLLLSFQHHLRHIWN